MSVKPFPLKVARVTRETQDAVSIHFENLPDGMSYQPGQYITVIAPVNGQELRRAYSLCSSPALGEAPAIGVKAVAGGLMSSWLTQQVQAGDVLQVLAPMGHFTFTPQPEKARHVVLIAAGSGITPLFSILKTCLTQEPKSKVTLVYGNRYDHSIMFKAQLDNWQQRYPGNLQVVHTLTCPPDKWAGPCGRINAALLEEVLYHAAPAWPLDGTLYYMCGPQEMMDAASAKLLEHGAKRHEIYRESFHSSVSEEDKQAAIEEAGITTRRVKVIYDDQEHEFEVSPEQSILEAALDLDIDLPYSCQSGLCTACRGKCHSGKVHMDETEGLSASEIDEGYVLTCVGHPMTADVVIEIG